MFRAACSGKVRVAEKKNGKASLEYLDELKVYLKV
jgi:hypothetical protein